MNFDNETRRAIILDHYNAPRNKGLVKDSSYDNVHQASESCIDDLYLQLKIENDIIVDARFDGVACAISTSSTSILSELLIGKTLKDGEELINNYENMCLGKDYDSNSLIEANAFCELHKQANRIKCGLIGPNGYKRIINGDKDE